MWKNNKQIGKLVVSSWGNKIAECVVHEFYFYCSVTLCGFEGKFFLLLYERKKFIFYVKLMKIGFWSEYFQVFTFFNQHCWFKKIDVKLWEHFQNFPGNLIEKFSNCKDSRQNRLYFKILNYSISLQWTKFCSNIQVSIWRFPLM